MRFLTRLHFGETKHQRTPTPKCWLQWRPASLAEVETLPLSEAGSAPDDVVLGQQRLRGLRAGLDQLSPRTREIFLLHRVEGYSHAQIAARMGVTVSAVEKQVAKAVLFLTEWMDHI